MKTICVHQTCFGVHKIKLKLSLDIFELQMKIKKKGLSLGVFFFGKNCSRHYEKIVRWGAQTF